MRNKKYFLGLDIGIASCGWGVISYDNESKQWDLDDFGVRIWQTPEKGKSNETNASFRRLKRSQRRLIQRRKARIKDLISLVLENDFLKNSDFIKRDESDVKELKEKYEDTLSLKVKGLTSKLEPKEIVAILINYAKNRGYNNEFEVDFKVPDQKEVQNLLQKEKDGKLSSLEAYTISINEGLNLINKYNKNPYPSYIYYHDDKFKMNDGPWKGKVGFKNNQKKTIDEETKKEKIEFPIHVVFERENYINELNKILDNQMDYPFIKKNRERIVNDIIFRQRNFEDGPGHLDPKLRDREKDLISKLMGPQSIFHKTNEANSIFEDKIGNCTFTNEKRFYKNSLLSDFFEILNSISKNSIPENIDKKIIKEFTRKCFDFYLEKHKITGKDLVKIGKDMNLDWVKFSKIKDVNILEKFKKIDQNWFEKTIKTVNLDNYSSLENNDFEKFSEIIYQNRTPKRLKKLLMDSFNFIDEKNGDAFIKKVNDLKFSKKVLSVSKKHILNSIKESLLEGTSLSKYQSSINEFNLSIKKRDVLKNKKHFSAIIDWDMIPNATVFRSLNQTRRLVYALHKKYKHFENIVIETAKEIYNDKKVRSETQSSQKKNEDLNNKALEFWNISNTSNKQQTVSKNSGKVLQYKLWSYQKIRESDEISIDPYKFDPKTKKFETISKTQLLNGGYDIEHIIPYSIHNDNSLNNIVLSNSKSNKAKGKKLAYEFMKEQLGPENIEKWATEIKRIFEDNEKKMNYLLAPNIESLGNNFDSQNLNDTRYITKYIKDYLTIQLENWNKSNKFSETKVLAVNGKVTSQFRKLWLGSDKNDLQKNVWGKQKVRNITHYHHAVDGIILANIINDSYNWFYTSMIKIKDLSQTNVSKLGKNLITKDEFISELNLLVDNLLKDSNHNKHFEGLNALYEIKKLRDEIIFKIENNKKLYLNWLMKHIEPIVRDLNEKIISRIPVKLEINRIENKETNKVEEQVALKEVLSIQAWSKQTNLHTKMYPVISYKINARVRGNFGSETIYGKLDKRVGKNLESFTKIKSTGGFIENDRYYGLFYDKKLDEVKSISKKQIQLNKKSLSLKGNKIFTWGTTFIDFETNNIYSYKGLGGPMSHFEPKLNFLSEKKRKLENRKILKSVKVLNVDILGKIKNHI